MKEIGFLGIDVSKGYADFLLIDADQNPLEKGFQLQDTKEGRQQLKHLIEQWYQSGLKTLCCGVESTGGYENNWYYYLINLGKTYDVKVTRLNPKAVKSSGDAQLIRTVTDGVSASLIAGYLVRYPDRVLYANTAYDASEDLKHGRQQQRFIHLLLKQKVQLSNQLEKVLYQQFGEVLVFCRHGIPVWLLRMLSRYPSADRVLRAGVDRLAKIQGISRSKANALIHKAQRGKTNTSAIVKHLIQSLAKEIMHKHLFIQQEKNLLIQTFQHHPDVPILQSIVGVGLESAVEIMLEIEHIDRFSECKKLCAYFGAHPTYKQSGDGIWKPQLSKKGRSAMRARLYMIGLTAIRYAPNIKKLYHRMRAKGMNHYQAMGVVMHKMLRIIYGVLKSRKKYDPEVDELKTKNAETKRLEYSKKLKDQNGVLETAKYRYQQPILDAPVSRRTARKRKGQIASQFTNQ